MNYCVLMVCSFVVISAVCGTTADASPSSINANIGREQPRNRREIPDECRPPFRRHHHHHHGSNDDSASADKNGPPLPPSPPPKCCELPDFIQPVPDIIGKCHRTVHETLGLNHKGHHRRHQTRLTPEQEPLTVRNRREAEETENAAMNKEDPHIDIFQEKRDCFASCMFNASGYILADDMLNEEVLGQKLTESIANNTKWTTIADSAFKKCIAAAKEANSQSQKTCKAGPSEYMKCISRELFFNCPSEIWNNSQECTEMKDRLEKCPNLTPPPAHHPPPHHHHHHHHHHHRRHHNKHEVNRNEDTLN